MENKTPQKGYDCGETNNAQGTGHPDGTHPSDYSKGKKPNDMSPSKSDGIVSVNR